MKDYDQVDDILNALIIKVCINNGDCNKFKKLIKIRI